MGLFIANQSVTTTFCVDFYQWIRSSPRLLLCLEAVERRELKPSLSHGVLGPGLSYRKGLSVGNPIFLFLIPFHLRLDPLRLYTRSEGN